MFGRWGSERGRNIKLAIYCCEKRPFTGLGWTYRDFINAVVISDLVSETIVVIFSHSGLRFVRCSTYLWSSVTWIRSDAMAGSRMESSRIAFIRDLIVCVCAVISGLSLPVSLAASDPGDAKPVKFQQLEELESSECVRLKSMSVWCETAGTGEAGPTGKFSKSDGTVERGSSIRVAQEISTPLGIGPPRWSNVAPIVSTVSPKIHLPLVCARVHPGCRRTPASPMPPCLPRRCRGLLGPHAAGAVHGLAVGMDVWCSARRWSVSEHQPVHVTCHTEWVIYSSSILY